MNESQHYIALASCAVASEHSDREAVGRLSTL